MLAWGECRNQTVSRALGLDFQQRVRNGYRVLAASDPQRWFKVDAAQGLQEVHQRIREHVAERLAEREGLPDVSPVGPGMEHDARRHMVMLGLSHLAVVPCMTCGTTA